MPRDETNELGKDAKYILDTKIFNKVIDEIRNEALKRLETDKLKGYGADSLTRDRSVIALQISNDLVRRLTLYANKRTS